jgi:hypothetical protein
MHVCLQRSILPERFSEAIRSHLELKHPTLLEDFDNDAAPGTKIQDLPYTVSFNWIGPSFKLVEKFEASLTPEPHIRFGSISVY